MVNSRWKRPAPEGARIVVDGDPAPVDPALLAAFLGERRPPLAVTVSPAPALEAPGLEGAARTFAAARIHDPFAVPGGTDPLPVEIAFERRRLADPGRRGAGVPYDGFRVQAFFATAAALESDLQTFTVVLTNQLIATLDPDDRRVHLRVAVFGFPSVVSIPGMVWAPARPRAHALARSLGLVTHAEGPGGDFLVPEDPRLQEVLKGPLLQALAYHMTGAPFCPDPDCRLFNAHRQEDLLRAQRPRRDDLCPEHRALLGSP